VEDKDVACRRDDRQHPGLHRQDGDEVATKIRRTGAGIGDLQHRIATLAMTESSEALRDALQGKSGADAIEALFTSLRSYIAEHPGRYNATTGAKLQGSDDPLLAATTRWINSIRAILSGYGIQPDELDHAIRMLRCMIHGYALLKAADAFQWSNDPDESVAWMIRFVDAGLTAVGDNAA
jgi:hypothetical protein